jgi:hypothetical protein
LAIDTMNPSASEPPPAPFYDRLRNAGIEPSDSEELRLNKSLLMLATGLACVALMVWVAIYSVLGPNCPPPAGFPAVLAGNMALYIKTLISTSSASPSLRSSSSCLRAQWAIGNFIIPAGRLGLAGAGRCLLLRRQGVAGLVPGLGRPHGTHRE